MDPSTIVADSADGPVATARRPPREGIVTPLGVIGLEHSAHAAAVAIALLYATGFVIVNSNLQQYEVLKYELVRTRYLAAGLLFFVICLPSSVMFTVPLRAALRNQPPTFIGKLVVLSLGVVGGFLASFLTWIVVSIPFVAFHTIVSPPGTTLWLAIIGLTIVAWLWLYKDKGTPETAPFVWTGRVYTGLVGLVVFAGANIFSTTVYPYIAPGYGGGEAWIVIAEPSSDSLMPVISRALTGPIAVVDRDEHSIIFLSCATGVQSGTEVAPSRIAILQVVSTISPDEYWSTCSKRSR